MITCKQVTKKYDDDNTALRDITFSLPKGKMAFLTGHSGAGKSTLLRLLTMLERPTSGQIIVNGLDLSRLSNAKIAKFRQNVGVVFQDPMLLNDRNVFENVALPLYVAGYSALDIRKRVQAALETVKLLDKINTKPASLSGGEQQRVGIARAIVNRPSILLADEPTGNLDAELSRGIIRLFERFNQVGATVLVATHDIELIENAQHPVLGLTRGQITHEIENTQAE
jgi:cell division transport system ATP-binding protein